MDGSQEGISHNTRRCMSVACMRAHLSSPVCLSCLAKCDADVGWFVFQKSDRWLSDPSACDVRTFSFAAFMALMADYTATCCLSCLDWCV